MSPISRLFPPISQFPDVCASPSRAGEKRKRVDPRREQVHKLPNGCVASDVDPFPVAVNGYGVLQILFLISVYSYFLLKGSRYIAEGGELLLLIPRVAPLIGSVILPILGALPDATLVIFSGLGPIQVAQQKISIGIGALAGATVMLVTLPWFLSVVAGRVDVIGGKCNYRGRPKLSSNAQHFSASAFWVAGVEPEPNAMRSVAITLGVTTIPYIIALGAAFSTLYDSDTAASTHERACIIASVVLCIVFFVLYLGWHMGTVGQDIVFKNVTDKVRKDAVQRGDMTFDVVFYDVMHTRMQEPQTSPRNGARKLTEVERMQHVLKHFFNKYDRDHNGFIDAHDIRFLLSDLRLPHTKQDCDELFARMDLNRDGVVHFGDFAAFLLGMYRRSTITNGPQPSAQDIRPHDAETAEGQIVDPAAPLSPRLPRLPGSWSETSKVDGIIGGSSSAFAAAPPVLSRHGDNDDDNDSDDEKSMPDDLVNLTPEEQRRHIMRRSMGLMVRLLRCLRAVLLTGQSQTLGLALVVLFSDPLIDALGQLAAVMNISAFYVSFTLAPLASKSVPRPATLDEATDAPNRTTTTTAARLNSSRRTRLPRAKRARR